MCNKAYYANRQVFNSSLISRNSQLQIYRTLVRPVATYGSESWTLTTEEERALAVFERKVLRKIYGAVKENELWRIRRNDALEAIVKGENIVRSIKSQRIRWLGHIERMQDNGIPKKLYGKLYAKRRRGRLKGEMAGRRVHGTEKDGCKRMERQSKGSRDLEAYRRGGQGPPRAVAPFKKKKLYRASWYYQSLFIFTNGCTIYLLSTLKFSRRMRWDGHVARMGEGRGVHRVLVGKPEGKGPLGRP
jgi:hypothetical protein